MANLQLISDILDERNLSITELCASVGITSQAYRDMLKRNSTKVEILERIASHLHVPVGYFFDETDNDKEEKNLLLTSEEKEIMHLKRLLAEKDARIADLKEVIKTLTKNKI